MRFIIFLFFLLIFSCATEPDSIYIGQDACKQCLMTISDSRFASLLWTDKAKTYKFDSIECLASYVDKNKITETDFKKIQVADFFKPEKMIPHDEAIFLVDSIFRSPMGLHIAAISKLEEKNFFEYYNWDKLVKYVDKKWNK